MSGPSPNDDIPNDSPPDEGEPGAEPGGESAVPSGDRGDEVDRIGARATPSDGPPADDPSVTASPSRSAGESTLEADRDVRTGSTAGTGSGLANLLPHASVDSRWWYWIAAVPVYFALSMLVGVAAFFIALFAIGLDILGLGGLATLGSFFLFTIGAVLFALPWLVLSVLFPIALYVDARAVSNAHVQWRPDPALYGLIGLVSVLFTANTVSVIVAIYYLYKRHRAIGTP